MEIAWTLFKKAWFECWFFSGFGGDKPRWKYSAIAAMGLGQKVWTRVGSATSGFGKSTPFSIFFPSDKEKSHLG